MGDGSNLKRILDKKEISVRKLAKSTGISSTTLYSIIQKDTDIRFDNALRIANALGIDVSEICHSIPFTGDVRIEDIYPTFPDALGGRLEPTRVRVYLKSSLLPLMQLFGSASMPDVDSLLTSFYQLDDEARIEIVEMIKFKLKFHKDPDRAEQIKAINKW